MSADRHFVQSDEADRAPHLADVCEEPELVESFGSLIRLVHARAEPMLVDAEARNFARGLRGELRTFRSSIELMVYTAVCEVVADALLVRNLEKLVNAYSEAGYKLVRIGEASEPIEVLEVP